MLNQGIVLENAGLYPNLTGKQNLHYLANINHKVGEEDVVKTLQRVGLNPQDKRIYQKYSLGMKQRLIIAQAIMEKPDIIFWMNLQILQTKMELMESGEIKEWNNEKT